MGGVGKAVGSVVGGLAGGFLGGAGAPPQVQSPISQKQFQQAYGQSTDAAAQQRKFLEAIAAQQGLQKQSDIYGQLGAIAQGEGPNPAQAMLANATGANVANQAALMAGQRGANANPALIARQAAMQGGNLQQQAVGQGAAMQAQQSMGAIGQQGAMANQMALQQQQEQANAFNNAQRLAGMGLGAVQQADAQNLAIQNQQLQARQAMMGQLMSAAGSAVAGGFGGPAAAGGGGVSGKIAAQAMAEGGKVHPASYVSRHIMGMAEGGKVPAMVSPGEKYLKPNDVKKVAQGADPLSVGEKIPGKPKHPGNDYRNDIVPKTLDEGGIVIPNKVLQSKDPHGEAAKFVAAILAKKGKSLPKKSK